MSEGAAERLQQLERDVRSGLHTVTREVAVERSITRDLVEALHVRIDRFEDEVMKELRRISAAVVPSANGADHG
jgi:hypothetical protein